MLAQRSDFSAQVNRLANGMERLIGELDGVRNGRPEEAFARVTAADGPADLPTVNSLDYALMYVHTSGKIGEMLDFSATEIGQLLGATGLRWAGDGGYQEIGRWQRGHTRFWHVDVPDKLRLILTEETPEQRQITNKVAISVFRRWKARLAKRADEQAAPPVA